MKPNLSKGVPLYSRNCKHKLQNGGLAKEFLDSVVSLSPLSLNLNSKSYVKMP